MQEAAGGVAMAAVAVQTQAMLPDSLHVSLLLFLLQFSLSLTADDFSLSLEDTPPPPPQMQSENLKSTWRSLKAPAASPKDSGSATPENRSERIFREALKLLGQTSIAGTWCRAVMV